MAQEDQGEVQSYYDTAEASEAFLDILDPMDSDEQPDDEDAGDLDEDVDQDDVDTDESDQEDGDEEDLDDSDSDDTDDEADDDESDEEQIEVTIDGEKTTVSLSELRDGYQRQADYTRKTQELATQRQQFEAYANQNVQNLQQQTQHAQALTQLLEQQVVADQNIDWDRLSYEDPTQYIRMKEQVGQRRELLNQAKQQHEQVKQQEQQLAQQKHAEFVEAQRQALFQEWPHWKDPEVAKREQTVMRDYLLSNGIAESDVQALADFNVIKLVEKARKYDELQSKKPLTQKRLREAPKVVKPKAAKSRKEQRQITQTAKHQRLKKSGSVQDAAALIYDLV